MGLQQCIKRKTEIFWQLLVGATFLICGLFIYHFLLFEGIIFSSQTSCYKSPELLPEKLINEECISMCNTKECIDISNVILRNMNQSADPCEDFYSFACGNFNERHIGNYSVLDQLLVDVYKIIRDIIESSKARPGSAEYKLKTVYESCMNTGSSEFGSMKSVLQFLKYMGIPNWPHLNSNFSFQSPTITEVLGRLATYHEELFVRFYESYDTKPIENGHLHNFSVAPQIPTFEDEAEVKELKKAVQGILRYTGMDVKEINRILAEFLDVDTQIYELYKKNSDWNIICEEVNATEFTVLDCTHRNNQNKYWLCRLVESIIRNGRITSRYTKNTVVIPCEFKYYIDRIFNLVNAYDARVIANYIALRVFINNLKYMDFSVRKNLQVYYRIPHNSEDVTEFIPELDRWKFCISWLESNMQYPLGVMYVSNMWPTEAAHELNEIFRQYITATKVFISKQEWIGDSVKDEILREVDEEENCIRYFIEGMRNETKMNVAYRRFHPTKTSFMRNVLSHKKFMFIASNLKTLEMNNFIEHRPFAVNAYGGDNIYLPFGILLPPVFRHGYPNLFNIAKIGQIIGHEIGHKLFYFFEQSLHVDNGTLAIFKSQQDCLVNQYFKFQQKQIKKQVQANITILENFPDNIGIKVTEKVSEVYLRDMAESKFVLPGLYYSPEKLLYISYAQMWCSVRTIEKERQHHERDYHSPPEFRIKGSLQNSQRFSEVFNCSATSFMNPVVKCTLFE